MHWKKRPHLINIEFAGKNFELLAPRGVTASQTGLLNHVSLDPRHGLLYKNMRFFHTFGMNFPICAVALDRKGDLLAEPLIVEPSCIFIAPRKCHRLFEVHPSHMDDFLTLWNKKKSDKKSSAAIRVIRNKSARLIKALPSAIIWICFAVFLLGIVGFAGDAEGRSIILQPGQVKKIDLGEAPRSIDVSNPDVVDVERVGFSNSISLIPRNRGSSVVLVKYARGTESVYDIQVGSNSDKSRLTSSLSLSSAARIAKDIQRIPGLESVVDDGKIVVLGNLNSLENFRALVRILGGRPGQFVPSFSIASAAEGPIVRSVREDLAALGETNLSVATRSGLFMLVGVPTSLAGKQRAMQYLSSVLPGYIDATDSSEGSSTTIQVNLQFLEVGKSSGTKIGITPPGVSAPLSGRIQSAPVPLNKMSSFATPLLQVAPLDVIFKAMQEKTFARELASPVIITRSGERASFLAGGEVPITSSTQSGSMLVSKVEYKPYGLQFAVTPKLQPDNTVWLGLDMEVSSVQDGISYKEMPAFLTRRLNTSIVLQEGNGAILSGLVRSSDMKNVEKVPILGHIPIIGELFKSRRFKEEETELWVAVTVLQGEMKSKKPLHLQQKFDEFDEKTSPSFFD
jgi:pilus assembly protein CpaC